MKATISDSDRREVARRLRDGGSVYGAGDFFDAVVFSLPPLPGKTNLTTNPTDLLHQLADVIDRPTCANLAPRKPDPFIPGKKLADGILECSNCQWHGRVYEYMTDWSGDLGAFEPRYCPHCGSEVVND